MASDSVAFSRKQRHRARLYGDDGRIERLHHGRGGLGDQHRRQHLRELDEVDGRDRRRTRRLGHEHMIGRGVGDERQDHVGIDVGHQFKSDRLIGIDTERAGPQAGQNQARRDRRAKRPESDQPLLVQPLNRQTQQRFSAACHDHGPTGPKLGQPPANAHLLTGSEQDGARHAVIVIWH